MSNSKLLEEYFNSNSLKLGEPVIKKIAGPTGDIIHTWHSEDGWFALTWNDDNIYTIWDLGNNQPLSSFGDISGVKELYTRNYMYDDHGVNPAPERIAKVTDVAITLEGKTAVMALDDSTCIIWDVQNSEPIMRLVGYATGATPIAITPDDKTLIMSQFDDFW